MLMTQSWQPEKQPNRLTPILPPDEIYRQKVAAYSAYKITFGAKILFETAFLVFVGFSVYGNRKLEPDQLLYAVGTTAAVSQLFEDQLKRVQEQRERLRALSNIPSQ